ncbi:head-tail joining protein [Thiorhodococcus fuscus]|uniref:Uncharacterized protein n=1 Tax=Thiorhodococcus fuscus TaxID=527200 RepID=A0ABW4Y8R4_9GAMM
MDNSVFFQPAAPGVVTVTVTPSEGLSRDLFAQWFRARDLSDSGVIELAGGGDSLQAPTTEVADLARGDTAVIDGVSYQITDRHDDGHGVSTLYLEPL